MTTAQTAQRTYATRIDLPEDVRKRSIELLNKVLAATIDAWTQTKYAHWNVKGLQFYQLHLLFDEIAEELDGYIDLTAERVTALGGTALGTCRMAAQASTLPEYALEACDGQEHLKVVAERIALYGKLVRNGIASADEWDDADTADLLTEISRTMDKRLWFLDAHMQHK